MDQLDRASSLERDERISTSSNLRHASLPTDGSMDAGSEAEGDRLLDSNQDRHEAVEDNELARWVARGDRHNEADHKFYKKWRKRIRYWCRKYGLIDSGSVDTRSIAQDVWLKLIEKSLRPIGAPGAYDPERGATFDTWATRVVMNTVRDLREVYQTRQRKFRCIELSDRMQLDLVRDRRLGSGSWDGGLGDERRQWQQAAVSRLMALLPKTVRDTVMGFYEGQTSDELAGTMGKSRGTVNNNRRRWIEWLTPILWNIRIVKKEQFEKDLELVRERYRGKF